MTENESALVKQLKSIEKQILNTLKSAEIDFDENTDEVKIKEILKKYIDNVKVAESLFEEYERVAGEIEKLSLKELKKCEKEVEKLKEQLKNDSEKTKEEKIDKVEEVTEVQNIDSKPIIKRRKKINGALKEF